MGQTIVDFALKMPLMVLVIAGTIDFSVAVGKAAQLTSAVQEGVTYGRRSFTDSSGIRSHVKLEAPGLSLSDGDISITCYSGTSTTVISCSSAWMSDSIKVSATYNYTPLTGRMLTLIGGPIVITQSATQQIY
jgi:Flp pilus assembly protein TadG